MDTAMIIELVGYLGSALVVISMLMTSVIRLRLINLVGCVIFTIYALIIKSYPTAAMNFFLVGINIYHLLRLMRTKRHYDLIRSDAKDGYFTYLLETSLEDIGRWFPEFRCSEAAERADVAYLVSCDRNPAALFLGAKTGEGEMEVLLDYSTPVYRDTTVGRFLYGELAKAGWQTLVFRMKAPDHIAYMERMGYRADGEGGYVLRLSNETARA